MGVHPWSQSRSNGSDGSARCGVQSQSSTPGMSSWLALSSAHSDVPCSVWSLIRKCEPWNRYIDFWPIPLAFLTAEAKMGVPMRSHDWSTSR
jgi:hypothetical protein